MDYDTHFQNIEIRLQRLEADSVTIHDRMGKVEDKASAAWKTINEVNVKVDKIEEKVNAIETDIKSLKLSQMQNGKDLKWIKWLVVFSAVVSVAFFIYIWRHDADLAKSILALGSTVATAI